MLFNFQQNLVGSKGMGRTLCIIYTAAEDRELEVLCSIPDSVMPTML